MSNTFNSLPWHLEQTDGSIKEMLNAVATYLEDAGFHAAAIRVFDQASLTFDDVMPGYEEAHDEGYEEAKVEDEAYMERLEKDLADVRERLETLRRQIEAYVRESGDEKAREMLES